MSYGNYAPFYRGGYFNPMQAPAAPTFGDVQNQFSAPYQTPMQTNTQPMQNPIAQATNDIIWVQGLEGAKSFLVSPNNTVTLWDSESPTIYVKSADMNGVPSMRILDFTERTANVPKTPIEHTCQCGDNFVTKEQFKALENKFEDLTAKFEDLKPKPTAKSKNKEGDE